MVDSIHSTGQTAPTTPVSPPKPKETGQNEALRTLEYGLGGATAGALLVLALASAPELATVAAFAALGAGAGIVGKELGDAAVNAAVKAKEKVNEMFGTTKP